MEADGEDTSNYNWSDWIYFVVLTLSRKVCKHKTFLDQHFNLEAKIIKNWL